MKNIIKTCILGTALLAFSCNEDLLNPIPPTTFSEAVVFETPARIDQVLNGLYATLKSGQFLGGRYLVYNDIRADEFSNRTTNGVTGLATWQHTTVSTTNEVVNLWSTGYLLINRANIFIDAMNTTTVVSSEVASDYIAQARFLRGITYYYLLQLYAQPYTKDNGASPGLPLRIQPELDGENNDMARSSVAEVYAQVLSDLVFAEENLSADRGNPYDNTTKAHKNTAIAFKTRVYLAMGDYAKVVVEADKIVSQSAPFAASSGVAHALQPTIAGVFSAPYTTTESIFSMPFTELNLPGGQNGLGSYYNPGPRGIGDYSLNMVSGVFTTNVFDAATDARANWMFENSNGFTYLNKFPLGPQHLDFAPVVRYAEVLLNLSEALVRSGGDNARALSLLNAVRTRSNPTGAYASFGSQDAFVEAILAERRLELVGEGFRSIDLLRNGLTIPGKENVQAVPPSSPNYIWPISSNELLFNKLMTPNN
jgi:hypothetical protein